MSSAATICANLRQAGLLDVAERVARRAGLKLADCIAPGRHPGHVALWSALARAGKTPAEIAALVLRQEAEISAVLPGQAPAPWPTPAPESGVRVRGRAKPLLRPVVQQAPLSFPDGVLARIALLEGRSLAIADGAARLREEAEANRRDLASLRDLLRGVETSVAASSRDFAIAHLRSHGDGANLAVTIAAARGVSPELLLSGSMQRDVCAARREIAVEFVGRQKMSRAQVARLLNVAQSAVQQMLRRASKEAA
jgi:plasmid maintenance system antidote protein VapI